MNKNFTAKFGPWAVVTGASSGIGLALAEKLASSGIHLILAARSKNTLESVAESLIALHGVNVISVACDLATSMGVLTLIAACEKREVGLLVASAGFGTSGRFHEARFSDEQRMLDVNCGAVLSLTHHFSGKFVYQGRGGIILLGSIVGFQGTPMAAHYAATKAYVQTLGEGIAEELRPYGVDVLIAAPGPVHTGFAKVANMQMGNALRPEDLALPILHALGKNVTVRPGLLSKFLSFALRTLPRWGRIRIMTMVMGGMTRHQTS